MRVHEALRGVSLLGVDTAAHVYFIDQDPRRIRTLRAVFRRVDDGRIETVTSTITLAEVLVPALRRRDAGAEEEYRSLLLDSDHLSLAPLTVDCAIRAARLRAQYGLATPDAIQLATAILAGCQAFLTNDGRLRAVSEIKVLILDD